MFRTIFATLCTALLSLSAAADVITIQPSKDATIYDDGVGNRADGAGATMYSGLAGTNTTWPVRRALVAFDVAAAVPAGATIQSVDLAIYMSKSVVGNKTFRIHRLTSGWNEGPTSGFSGNGNTAAVGDTTWLHTFWNNQFWTTAGGDFVPTQSASAVIGGTFQFYTWTSTAAMVSDVQGWLDTPSTNHGWIVIGPETGGKSAKQFESSESLAQFRPKLTITYVTGGPTTYCTAKTNSLGCVPAIGFSGVPDANAGSGFVVSSTNTLSNKTGLLFYSTSGPTALSFQGGTLCVTAPLIRTPAQSSGGNVFPPDCSGAFAFDFNVRIASGADPALVAGASVWAQYWSRDPAATFTTNLSDALAFLIQP